MGIGHTQIIILDILKYCFFACSETGCVFCTRLNKSIKQQTEATEAGFSNHLTVYSIRNICAVPDSTPVWVALRQRLCSKLFLFLV